MGEERPFFEDRAWVRIGHGPWPAWSGPSRHEFGHGPAWTNQCLVWTMMQPVDWAMATRTMATSHVVGDRGHGDHGPDGACINMAMPGDEI